MSDDIRLARIEKKTDKIIEHLTSIDITLAQQHVSLKDHIRRTNLLEEHLIPIQRHVSMVNGAIKLLLLLSALAGIYAVFK